MLNFKAGKNAPPIEENAPAGDKDGNANTPEEDGNPQSTVKGDDPEKNNKPKQGEAYESSKKSPSYQKGQSDGGPGTWEHRTTPKKGASYQEQVTGAPKDTEYVVKTDKMKSGEKKFDGYDPERNSLIDAKDWTDWPPQGQKWAEQKNC